MPDASTQPPAYGDGGSTARTPAWEETADLAGRLARSEVAADTCVEWCDWTPAARRECIALACYEIGRQRDRRPQRMARRLFRSWLTQRQRDEHRRRGSVVVRGSAGGTYRVQPESVRTTVRVERHGSRWYARGAWYCLHPEDVDLPPADLALAHLLLLTTDEPAFLAAANAHAAGDQMWDRDYLRRLREARDREAAA